MQVDALHLQIWLYPLGKCKISNTNMLINSELREDNITKPIHEKTQLGLAECASRNERYVIVSHVQNAVSLWLEQYSGSVGAMVKVLQCFPFVGTFSSGVVQKLPLTAYSLRIVASV